MTGAPKGQHNAIQKERIMSKRKFSREFKLSAVQLVNQKGYSVSEAARSLGVDPSCVRYWIEKLGSEAGMAPSGEGEMAAELRRLRQENARLLIERDILKKAAAFFAREPM
jgi:transposase